MKPQREGGGNNFYGKDVRRVLKVSQLSKSKFSSLVFYCVSNSVFIIFPADAANACAWEYTKEMSETELSAYILMQRIFPAAVRALHP